MCGIVAIVNKEGRNVIEGDIKAMCSMIIHRGPDDEGIYCSENVGIGMRRLSIVDLNTGHQPIHNEDKTLWIVFNGEIFNFNEIKQYLISKGHQFYTDTDTEVIIHLYEQEGEECLQKLRGMFAFVIYDNKNKQLFIARDRVGIKPLFYCETGKSLLVASEMKSILRCNDEVDKTMSWKAFDSFFNLSYIPDPLTIYRGIHQLMPGHFIKVSQGKMTIKKYWDLHYVPDLQMKEREAIEKFMGLLEESVKLRLISDVPLGAFLSGGLDSSIIVALMSKYHDLVKTITIGYGGDIGVYDDERKYAKMISDIYKTDHKEYEVRANSVTVPLIEDIITAFDQPFADHGAIPMYFICKLARENMTVALSGLGGDEVLSGYPRYLGFRFSEIYELLPKVVRQKIVPRISELLPENRGGEVRVNWVKRFFRGGGLPIGERYLTYLNLLSRYTRRELFSKDIWEALEKEQYGEEFLEYFYGDNARENLNRVYYTDIKTYLPGDILTLTDRISMRHSLEVRVPFLDHKLLELSATIPPKLKMKNFTSKYLLKKATAPFLPKRVMEHKKQGFTGPISVWINKELKNYINETLSSDNGSEYFNQKTIARIFDEHIKGEQLNTSLIWSIIIFKTWHKMYL